MKWLTAGLTFVNLSVVCGLLLGMAGRGLTVLSASLALICGAAFAVAAYLGTADSGVQRKPANDPAGERKPRKSAIRTESSRGEVSEPENTRYAAIWSAFMRYRRIWFWGVAVCFAIFAVRSFCWLLYIAGNVLCIFSMGRHLRGCRLPVQRRNSRLPIFHNTEVFGLSGWQQNRLEKHSPGHVRDAAGLALRDPGSLAAAVALAREILPPRGGRFSAAERPSRRRRTSRICRGYGDE